MTKNGYCIRLASDEDFQHLPAVEDAAGDVYLDIGYDDIAAMPATPATEYPPIFENGGWVLVAVTDTGQIIGYCANEKNSDVLYVKELSVHKDFAKQGIGTKLLNKTIEEAIARHFKSIFLLTFKDVPFNAPYYARFGFQIVEDLAAYPDIKKRASSEKNTPLWKYGRVAMKKDLT